MPPSTRATDAGSPAPNSSVEPGGAANAASSCSDRNFAIGERTSPSAPWTMYARPFAPHSFATSSSLASSARENSCGTTMNRTVSAPPKTPNSEPRVTSVASWISTPKRRSGLSVPYFAIASS